MPVVDAGSEVPEVKYLLDLSQLPAVGQTKCNTARPSATRPKTKVKWPKTKVKSPK